MLILAFLKCENQYLSTPSFKIHVNKFVLSFLTEFTKEGVTYRSESVKK
jgi:hypothetical protein